MSLEPSIEAALAEVEESILGDESILVHIRSLQGLNQARYARLVAAIRTLVIHYRGKQEVPKRLALAFVDISNYFYYTEHEYSRDELERLEDAGQELTRLAEDLFS